MYLGRLLAVHKFKSFEKEPAVLHEVVNINYYVLNSFFFVIGKRMHSVINRLFLPQTLD